MYASTLSLHRMHRRTTKKVCKKKKIVKKCSKVPFLRCQVWLLCKTVHQILREGLNMQKIFTSSCQKKQNVVLFQEQVDEIRYDQNFLNGS